MRRCVATASAVLAALVLGCWVTFRLPAEIITLQSDPELVRLHSAWHAAVRKYALSTGHDLSKGGVVVEQAWAYLDLARHNASVVCETGFWKGVSTHLWLTANPANQVHSFDTHFPEAAVAVLRAAFGANRLQLHRGSTRMTLPRFQPSAACDVVSIDADHSGWAPYQDLLALLPHARCNATVLFDDTFDDRSDNKSLDNNPYHASFYNACTRSYWQLVREGVLHHVACTNLGRRLHWGKFPKGFCLARRVCQPAPYAGQHFAAHVSRAVALPAAQSPAPAQCRRHYNATPLNGLLWRSVLAVISTGPHCHGAAHQRQCKLEVAKEIGLHQSLPAYSELRRRRFLERFDQRAVRHTRVRPTPWLTFGEPLEESLFAWLRPRAPESSAVRRSTHFYGNKYTDLAVFTHFFAHPPVVGGIYVEIGGSNGVHASNTLFFEQHLNWSGVLIEPTPCGRCMLPFTRPRDITINAGACVHPRNLSGATAMAGAFCASPQDACVARTPGGYDAFSVQCRPMSELLPPSMQHIDFLSIDVENHVMEVLETIPWERVTVDVVLAECSGALEARCVRLLRQRGFRTLSRVRPGGDVLAVREGCLR